jgi:hypothetical protein
MKISKRQLRRIIREEKQKLNESAALSKASEDLYTSLDAYVQILDEDMGYDVDNQILKAEVLNMVDGYFEDAEYAAKEHSQEEKFSYRDDLDPGDTI